MSEGTHTVQAVIEGTPEQVARAEEMTGREAIPVIITGGGGIVPTALGPGLLELLAGWAEVPVGRMKGWEELEERPAGSAPLPHGGLGPVGDGPGYTRTMPWARWCQDCPAASTGSSSRRPDQAGGPAGQGHNRQGVRPSRLPPDPGPDAGRGEARWS